MTRKRVTKGEKKQRHEWAMRQIDAGMGLSELTAFTAETWGCSRRNARDVVAAAHKDWLNCPYVSSEVAVPIVSGLLREAPTEHSVPDLRLLPCRFLQTFSALEMSECQNRSASSSRNLKKTEMHSFRGPIPLVRTPSTSSRCSPVRSRRTFAAVRVAS